MKLFGSLSIEVRPAVRFNLLGHVQIGLASITYWRQSIGGVYGTLGHLPRAGTAEQGRFIGKQVEVAAIWQATPDFSFEASFAVFAPGAFNRETGPAQTIRVTGLEAIFRI